MNNDKLFTIFNFMTGETWAVTGTFAEMLDIKRWNDDGNLTIIPVQPLTADEIDSGRIFK